MHPDKARPDAALNETLEMINERWVEITKAYKTLTDEDVRRNYEEYGNPDGKQSTSIGIALPQFLVAEGNGKYVMIVYGALIGILLPYFVGSWWYGSQKRTKEGVLVTSVGKLFKEFSERIDLGGVISALSVGDEYDEILKGHKSDAGLGQVEKRILAPGSTTATAAGLTKKNSAVLQDLDDGTRRKTLALIWAYLGRIELDDAVLNEEKIEVAPTALALNDAFVSICLAYMFTSPAVAAFQASQNIIQAISPGAPPLLQLPYLDRAAIKHIEGAALSSQRKHLTVQGFMDIPDAKRREVTKNAGISSKQYESIVRVASQLPRLVVEKTFFKVSGEKYVLPGSLVQFVVKARFIPPGSTNIPDVHPSDFEDKDPDEADIKARREEEAQQQQFQPPLVHAPYFARDHAPRWNLFLTDIRQGKIAVPPFTFQTFDKPILDADGKPTYAMQTLKMQFQAPPNAGLYRFQMHLVCDSYVGFDDKRDVSMTIEDESKAAEVESDDEISEPDEGESHVICSVTDLRSEANVTSADSIAGQMAALKGQAPSGKSRRRVERKAEADSSDEEESGTDEDVDSESDTDTDTDTDEE